MRARNSQEAAFSDVILDFRRMSGEYRDGSDEAQDAGRRNREKYVPSDERTNKLRYIVQNSGGTKQVAARAGVALSTLGSYLAGGEMKLSTAMQICAACGVSLAWLIGDADTVTGKTAPAIAEGYVPVQIARPAGTQRGEPLEPLMFSSNWLQTQLEQGAERLVAVEVKGSAMEPSIHQGDLLLIDTSANTVSSLDVHLIEVGGELLVRRLERTVDGALIMRTDNDRFAPQVIARDDQEALTVVGRVVWKGSATPL